MKKNSEHDARSGNDPQEVLLHLPLDGLLPPNQTLILNPSMRTATLFVSSSPDGETQMLSQQRFTPNGMRVLVPLLQAYPQHCSYEVLIASLYSLTLAEARQQLHDSWEIALRPVRRAISGLMAGLRALGLHVRSLHGAGYMLESLSLPRA